MFICFWWTECFQHHRLEILHFKSVVKCDSNAEETDIQKENFCSQSCLDIFSVSAVFAIWIKEQFYECHNQTGSWSALALIGHMQSTNECTKYLFQFSWTTCMTTQQDKRSFRGNLLKMAEQQTRRCTEVTSLWNLPVISFLSAAFPVTCSFSSQL